MEFIHLPGRAKIGRGTRCAVDEAARLYCRIRDGATTRIRIIKRRELSVLAASLAGGEQEKGFSGGEQEKKLPLVNRTSKALSHWLSPAYGAVLELKPGLDQIEALSSERDALWTRLLDCIVASATGLRAWSRITKLCDSGKRARP